MAVRLMRCLPWRLITNTLLAYAVSSNALHARAMLAHALYADAILVNALPLLPQVCVYSIAVGNRGGDHAASGRSHLDW